ncbi:hypothetical protein DKX38_021002 [Salix brachista]|uniref:Uncharacterized protein n=1 Tax=Salix brachista TaxID=2182728 RepID=A0A5N5KBK6_9ROSI|nr:hypothetical protein DKX38_021002 [Salix brachista]
MASCSIIHIVLKNTQAFKLFGSIEIVIIVVIIGWLCPVVRNLMYHDELSVLNLLFELLDGSKPLTAFRSFDNPRREIVRAPVRSKSMLSAFFVKQKTSKLKAGSVS